jgi:matrixin
MADVRGSEALSWIGVLDPLRIGRFPAVLAFCAALAGCSGSSSPTQPSTPGTPAPGSVPVIRDGTTEQVVAAQVDPPAPRVGSRVSVSAPGFLTREQLFDVPDIFLWPGEASYIHDLAYTEFTDGTFRTIRWSEPFTITLDADVADDPAIVSKAQQVAAEVSRHIGFLVRVGSGGAVTIGVDQSLEDRDAVGEATVSYRGATIASARVLFWRRFEIAGGSQANYPNTLLHEMGHVIGLGHSPRNTDVMTPAEGPGSREATYQPGEAACLHMSYAHRRPGNFFPDRDPALTAASSATPRRTVIVN